MKFNMKCRINSIISTLQDLQWDRTELTKEQRATLQGIINKLQSMD